MNIQLEGSGKFPDKFVSEIADGISERDLYANARSFSDQLNAAIECYGPVVDVEEAELCASLAASLAAEAAIQAELDRLCDLGEVTRRYASTALAHVSAVVNW